MKERISSMSSPLEKNPGVSLVSFVVLPLQLLTVLCGKSSARTKTKISPAEFMYIWRASNGSSTIGHPHIMPLFRNLAYLTF